MSGDHHHDHDHDHDHGHAHSPPQPDDKVHTYHQILSIALKELLIEKGVVTAAEVRSFIEKRDSITPAHGAKVVARASPRLIGSPSPSMLAAMRSTSSKMM